MMLFAAGPVAFAAATGLIVLSVAVLLCLARFALGPTLADRVAALDMIATLLVALFVLFGVAESQPELVRVATVLALLNFLATVAFASYIRRKAAR